MLLLWKDFSYILCEKEEKSKKIKNSGEKSRYFLGVLTHTTAWDRLWGGEQTQVLLCLKAGDLTQHQDQ